MVPDDLLYPSLARALPASKGISIKEPEKGSSKTYTSFGTLGDKGKGKMVIDGPSCEHGFSSSFSMMVNSSMACPSYAADPKLGDQDIIILGD